MKLKEFRKKMVKTIFTSQEAKLIMLDQPSALTNLQLHQWEEQGELIRIKRGVYFFSEAKPKAAEIANVLYPPCYFSLEYALSNYGILAEATFNYTLITPRGTRRFATPAGIFHYHKIKREAFTGFDETTLMAEPEKAVVDYFYFRGSSFKMNKAFWEESRLEGGELNFKKIFRYAKLFDSKRLIDLLLSFQNYAKSH